MQDNNDPLIGLDSIKVSYKSYKKSTKNPLEYKLFMLVAYTFFDEFKKGLIEGLQLRLFSDLGSFSIKKKKINLKKLKPDWEKTKELWSKNEKAKNEKKLVFHLNQHTKGHYYLIYWTRGYIKNITHYSFKPVRKFQRELSSMIKSGEIDYAN